MLTLDEAIAHCKEKAEELKDEANIHCDIPADEIADCLECANEHLQLAEWLTELKELREFTKFVRGEVLDNYFEESSGAFAEIACRKLIKLGYVELDENVYKVKDNNK